MTVMLRYEVATGRVNLIVHGDGKPIPADGCQYMMLPKRPHFSDQENLYVRDGRIIAIDNQHQPPLHRIVE